uniref:Fibronectin type-III domain-containing protein n=1 Tax=Mola mola TaxID=94237 RepID=A0A3Q3XM86_MOLML
MTCWTLSLCLVLLLGPGEPPDVTAHSAHLYRSRDRLLAAAPPVPVNVSVHSVNFRHVLRWDPGPGTPPGTHFVVYNVQRYFSRPSQNFSQLWAVRRLSAFHSRERRLCGTTRFIASHTKIGPSKVSLAGCGNCIRVNVSLPEADSSSSVYMHKMYNPTYRVVYKERGGKIVYNTESRSFNLTNLHSGSEYCVQVHALMRLNKNTKPSNWTCTFTSMLEANTGAVSVVLILVIAGLMTSVLCLYYAGFICKLKATLPTTLLEALSQSYTLTPERTIPELVSISPETVNQRKHNSPTPLLAAGSASSEEEEEEEGLNVYMDRGAELSAGGTSCEASGDVSAVTGYSRSLMTDEAEPEAEANDEGAEDPVLPEEAPIAGQEHATGEEAYNSSGDVNLFSVILVALDACEEEEQDTKECSNRSDPEPLLCSQSAHDCTAVAVEPPAEDVTESGSR